MNEESMSYWGYNETARARVRQLEAAGWLIDSHGNVTNPGMYEGEPWATIFFHDLDLDLDPERRASYEEWEDGEGFSEFALPASELADWGLGYHSDTGSGLDPSPDRTIYVVISGDSQGMMSLSVMAQSTEELNGYGDEDEYQEEPMD